MLTAIGRHGLHPPGRAKPRGHIAGLGRYAEHRGLCCLAVLGATLSVPVSAVCGRRNEREHPAKSAKLSAAANGADGKLTSPASGAGGTVRKRRKRHLARAEAGGRPGARQRKARLAQVSAL